MQRMAFSIIGAALILIGCGRSESDSETTTGEPQRVTLYTSVDDEFARMVVAQFEEETGISVDVLGDTEATKTTGLVTRLQSEKDNPTCDVWWASEPMGTILLARDGVLEPGGMEGTVGEDWPNELHAQDWSWVGTALRSRVIVYAPGRVEEPPTSMHELIDPKYKGRIGMARPQFGTTRIHMALLAASWDPQGLEQWLEALKANGVRLYDGNASVVRGVAMGEIDVGLTDTDDVWSGQENGWDVEIAKSEREAIDIPPASRFYFPVDRVLIPNTVAVIKGAPNPDLAKQLAAYLTSASVERLLYESTSGNLPVNKELREELGLPSLRVGFGGPSKLPEYVGASELNQAAMDACERVLGP
tara:strand:+ start:14577 stop:15656 length:1080 start_codon:yes stop_codon:yes gene_type:complete